MSDKAVAHSGGRELVGRDRELAQIARVLERRLPALLLITGLTGMGKSSFLREVERRAAAVGWRVALGRDENSLSVSVDSSEHSFRDQVRKILNLLKENLLEIAPPVGQPSGRPLVNDPLVAQLAAIGPSLILIDGYQPAPDFDNWFTGRFLRDVKASGKPLIVTVAEIAGRIDTLTHCADELLELGRLERSALEAHFAQIGRRITPPMSDAEVAHYVDSTLDRPDLVGNLTRVLALAAASPAPGSPNGC